MWPQVGTVGEEEEEEGEWKVLFEKDRPPASDTLEIPNLIPFTQYRWAFLLFQTGNHFHVNQINQNVVRNGPKAPVWKDLHKPVNCFSFGV